MRSLLSALHLFLVFSLFATATFFLVLYLSPHLLWAFAQGAVFRPHLLLLLSGIVSGIALLLLIGFFLIHRRRLISVEMDGYQTDVDRSILEDYVQVYWKKHFPGKFIPTQVQILSKKKLEILSEVPPIDQELKEKILLDAEKEIGKILYDQFRYQKKFTLTLSFLTK